ncbi:MAG TPA: hypothetical protein QF564_16070, partial [Pirellulaceae bacterium]|nr:hypothetical protein [Pirellulaceae bacterium]
RVAFFFGQLDTVDFAVRHRAILDPVSSDILSRTALYPKTELRRNTSSSTNVNARERRDGNIDIVLPPSAFDAPGRDASKRWMW